MVEMLLPTFEMLFRWVVSLSGNVVVFSVESSRCAGFASTSLASWPVTAAVSHHLPVKAALFLCLIRCQAEWWQLLAFQFQLAFFLPASWNGWLHHLACLDVTSHVPLVVRSDTDHISATLMFKGFFFCVFLLHPTYIKTLICFLLYFSNREIGNAQVPKRLVMSVKYSSRLCNLVWVIFSGTVS